MGHPSMVRLRTVLLSIEMPCQAEGDECPCYFMGSWPEMLGFRSLAGKINGIRNGIILSLHLRLR
jgi:hypothetical protein